MMKNETFAEVVALAQQGDRKAYEEIVNAWRRRTLGMVARMIGRPDDAEDVAQDVFVRLYLSLNKLREPAQFESWMYRLIANAAIDYLRRHKRVRIRVSDLSDEQIFTVERSQALGAARDREDQRELRDYLERMLGVLSPESRALLVLKEVEGLSIRELGAAFGISEEAVKVRLFRARQRILRTAEKNEVPAPGFSLAAAAPALA